jgi:D-alanyl-D-alanine carboxypeptidase
MSVSRRARLLAAGAVVVALSTTAFVATAAASAPQTSPASGGVVARTAPVRPASVDGAGVSRSRTSASAVPAALRASAAKPGTRLTLTVRRGRTTLAVVGVLTRVSTGDRVANRSIEVYQRRVDTGRWQLVRSPRTSLAGRVEYDLRDRPLLQFTLRFRGDYRFGPAASQTIVPEPTGALGLKPSLVTALARARAVAARAGLPLVVNSGFRTWARQQQMYDAAVRRYGSDRAARHWVLPPQESTHVRGLAVDLGPPAAAAWLTVRGAQFGLCRAYADEAWHFEYRPDWVAAFARRCPPPVAIPGDPDPLSPAPRVPVR